MNRYNVIWTSPSHDSSGSMPLGNGDLGLNVWVEPSGDLLLLISKTDTWNENARLLKLGRLRLSLCPPLDTGADFQQVLRLENGTIEIYAGGARLVVWADANASCCRLEMHSDLERRVTVAMEMWRDRDRTLDGAERHSAYGIHDSPEPIVESADILLDGGRERLLWCHRNERSPWAKNWALQALEAPTDSGGDPLLGLTFGAAICGPGLRARDRQTLVSDAASRECLVEVHALTSRTSTVAEWTAQLDRQIAQTHRISLDLARANHEAWWREFWDRSFVHASGTPSAEAVSQAYALQRFITACAGRGKYPIKFNGSIFTFETAEPGMGQKGSADAPHFDADYRRWGGPYWFQNTRLIYWPLLASGDFEMLAPFFAMYRAALPAAQERTRKYFGHEGAFFPETMTFWGTYADFDYNYNRTADHDLECASPYIRRYWQGGLELCAMMLEFFAFTDDSHFAMETLLPMAREVLTFYREHFPRHHGHLHMEPAQSLETWWEVVNPAPDLAGLQHVLKSLLALPELLLTDAPRELWRSQLAELPPLPREDGVLTAAQTIRGSIRNGENPELYAIFPYPLFGVGRDALSMAQRTFARRRFPENGGWQQSAIQAACLGLASEARDAVTAIFATAPDSARFQAFWGPNFDWTPDQCHGNVGTIALQKMLLQVIDDQLHVLPAWPREWDVTWKLHAPGSTTVSGTYLQGKLEKLEIDSPGNSWSVHLPGSTVPLEAPQPIQPSRPGRSGAPSAAL